MDVINNSTIDTVIDFANVKFGMELTKDQVSEQLRNLSFSETLKLINSIKADDNDAFSSIIDLSAVSEGWSELPSINREKYQERDGLEGPFPTKSGKVVYYDPKEGKYYDPDTDIYLSYEEWKSLDEAYGTQSTAQPSRATIRAQGSGVEQRRYNITAQDQNRDATAIPRTVAGAPPQGTVATGQGASRVGSADPDDIHRSEIEGQANANAQAGAQRDAEIERLKQLAMGS
ncbi:hypothetical protein N9E03_00935 [bacterium]|jgi:hypothetical protein|nr:hypothetical protein [bacterium]